MENLSFLALLICPLMMAGLFFMILKGNQSKDGGQQNKTEELHQNMNKLMKQNEQLLEEIDRLKRSR
ncbi:hypothetical protein BKP45_15395 [Anaerobacillus alkalidiazotrophicus]|uniref:DUF2933 domain-containing protein n=1 Tax=Anaerobacillus alkalidiazotrophicus TaxID=472963 RepID=A0A1S2M2E9_9BACI|nr:hypothetical protein [Anaerobacillus alkalidiazotrophicus]OIJ18908.1 hypothetical protein BKP45_15395 [Anaerobacillus alkalidiazotrophicus]